MMTNDDRVLREMVQRARNEEMTNDQTPSTLDDRLAEVLRRAAVIRSDHGAREITVTTRTSVHQSGGEQTNIAATESPRQPDTSVRLLTITPNTPSTQWPRSRHTGIAFPNLYHVVLIDIARSAARTGTGQRRMREDLYHIVNGVLATNGLRLTDLPFDDRGDGLRLIVPLHALPTTQVVDLFVLGLAAALREHRHYVVPAARIRMRVCFDFGLLQPHRSSWTGDALVRAARLIEAQGLHQALLDNPNADLAAIVSDFMYQSVVRQGYGYIPLHSFRPTIARVKELHERAWLLTPATLRIDSVDPTPDDPSHEAERPTAPSLRPSADT